MQSKRAVKIILAMFATLLLILDTKTATYGAQEGVEICVKVLIPSLFPFFILTSYLNAALMGLSVPGIHLLSRWLQIPTGAESLLLLGLIGGYPVGAQLIADTYRRGHLSKRNYQILLGYCSNAGPAFIFGISSALFSSKYTAILLWVIQVVSACFTGFLLPRPDKELCSMVSNESVSLVSSVRNSIRICGSVCGWVIAFKVIIAYFTKYLSPVIGAQSMLILSGILELSNGCLGLASITREPIKFIICTAFLSFGGFCVMLQTTSVTGDLGLGLYIPGKVMQSITSVLIAAALSCALFSDGINNALRLTFAIPIIIPTLYFLKKYAKKRCGNPQKLHV